MLFIATMLYVAVSCMHDIIMLFKNKYERVLIDVRIIILPISPTTIFSVLIKTI